MTDALTNLFRGGDAAANLTRGSAPVVVDRLASQLVGTGIFAATYDAAGRLVCIDANASRFFTRYAVPALQALGPIAQGAEAFDDRVPGVLAMAVPAAARRVKADPHAPHTTILIARHGEFCAGSEAVQQWCARLELDATWLADEAGRIPLISRPLLSRLADMTAATSAAEQRVTSLQGELDSLSGQLSDTYEELSLIYQISSGMRVNRRLDDFFKQACTEVIEVMGVRAAGFAVVDSGGRVETRAMFGEIALEDAVCDQLQDELIRRFAHSPKPLLNNHLADDAVLADVAAHASQLLAVPIQRQDKVLGLLFCLDKTDADFTTQDSKLLNSIANETAIYLENSSLFSDARGMMMGLLHALTSAVDAKDTYTCGHSQRVALFGREIAARAGLPEAFCERVYMSGLLHDVGKIGVPEEVLRKPGKLTDEEFGLMKKHVEIGARILKDVKQVADLIPGVLYHHERYDGKGYPHNLAGQDIPLIARILCVADCFDAMTSNRTYRKALPIEVALMEIRRCAGTQFDPMLADAFLSIGAPRLRELIGTVTDDMAIQIAA